MGSLRDSPPLLCYHCPSNIMERLFFRTAGESHGKALIALVEGIPEGVAVDQAFVDGELRRRQGGYGRGGRQKIETDHAEFLSGVRLGKTIGSPIAMEIVNKDARLDDPAATPPLHRPRPGHADLAGSVKWLTTDCRLTLERARRGKRRRAWLQARCPGASCGSLGSKSLGLCAASGRRRGSLSSMRRTGARCSRRGMLRRFIAPTPPPMRRCGSSSTIRKWRRTRLAESSRRMFSAARSDWGVA